MMTSECIDAYRGGDANGDDANGSAGGRARSHAATSAGAKSC